MLLKTSYSQNQLRDYSSLFSRSEVQLWMKNDFTSIDYKIERYDAQWLNYSGVSYIDYLKHIYNVLETHYQTEYIFKNSFLNEWLIKEIGESNSRVFNEYRVGNAVADLVMFNGISKVFEIKTEYDSDKRLALQLESYRKAFNQIFLIIPESKLTAYKITDERVGLISFNGNKEQKFTLQREAVINQEVDAETIMHILHTHEYKTIVKSHFGQLPDMTSFNQFQKCRELIKTIPNHLLNKYFIEQMKRRNLENVLSRRYYKEFNQLILAHKLNKDEKNNMIKKLKSPLKA
jgi:hypothetical protein